MSKRREKVRRKLPSGRNSGQNAALSLRRVPQPRQSPPPFIQPVFNREGLEHPVAQAITEKVHRAARASTLSTFVIVTDWLKMTEAALACHAENMKSIVIQGQVIEDPPDIAAIFRAARNRYRAATEQNPSVYRIMQESFLDMYALLIEAGQYGLRAYRDPQLNPEGLNPDIVGLTFLTCLDYPTRWHKFFPSWQSCQAIARQLIPDPAEIVHEKLLPEAALRTAEATGSVPELIPGTNWEVWWSAIREYIFPHLIGPDQINSCSTLMLALAARFEEWSLQHHLIHFHWQTKGGEPLLDTLCHLNMMLYGLNGYYLEQAEALVEIAHYQAEQDRGLPSATESPDDPPDHPLAPVLPSAMPTFADLFREGGIKRYE